MKPTLSKTIIKIGANLPVQQETDELVVEEPLEIRVDTQALNVTMRTPGDDEDLAAGFLFTEGIIGKRDDLLKILPYARNEHGNVIDVFLRPELKLDTHRLKRNFVSSSSCGLCGKESILSIQAHFPAITSKIQFARNLILQLPEYVRDHQQTFIKTGGLHAAAIFDQSGRLIVLREDIGRHNAVDKVIGHAYLRELLPLNAHVLLVSGRVSFEIMQKALAAAIPVVAAVSAPSSLAVDFSETSGQTVIGFLRNGRMNVYSHPEHIL